MAFRLLSHAPCILLPHYILVALAFHRIATITLAVSFTH
jgi:hypothetical protein